MNAEYTFLVEKAKNELRTIKESKAEIARLAVQACTLRHGRTVYGTYDLKTFAQDVGVSYGSLTNWVRIYKLGCQNNGVEAPTEKQWADGVKTVNKFKTLLEGMTPNQRVEIEGHRPGCEMPDRGKKLLNNIHQDVIKGKYYSGSDIFNEVLKDLKRIHQKANKLDLETQDAQALLSSMIVCDEISDMINLFLTNKKKRKAS